MTSYDPTTGYYATEDIDPADYAPVAYAECQACGEQADDIHALMGMNLDAIDGSHGARTTNRPTRRRPVIVARAKTAERRGP